MKKFANNESVTLAVFPLADDIPLPRFTISAAEPHASVITLKAVLPHVW
jgi:hypothetical protein